MSEPKQPPHTIRIKRPRDEAPITSLFLPYTPATTKRIKTTPSPSPTPPSYVFRLAHTVPTFQPITKGAPATPPPKQPKPDTLAPPENDKKRKTAPVVRKFMLSKKARMHPYARGGSGVIFERVREETDTEPSPPPPPPEEKKRKKPRTHPKEKEMMKSAVPAFQNEDEELMREMEKMVLEYLEDENNEGIRNLPPTDKIGGGVGGGKWDDTKEEEEDEDGFVYDVYFREEVPRGKDITVEMKDADAYGLLVFQGSDDEDWWYEGAREGEGESDAFVSDDEDSNAEEYYANEYPDEPDDFEDDVGEFAQDSDDDSDDIVYRRWRPKEEEYDLENDESEEEEEAKLTRFQKGIWT